MVNMGQLPYSSISEMNQVLMNDHSAQDTNAVSFFKVSGMIDRILSGRQIWYEACPECKKKVVNNGFGGGNDVPGYYCERC
jgi:hypothetical protein